MAPTPTRKRRRRIFAAVIVALLAYPVLGTLALWTGLVERVLQSEDLRVEIANPAYTLWPGRVHAKHVRVLVNGETQFILEGDDLLVDVRIRGLFSRRVHVTELTAQGVRYQMRVQVDETKGIEERVAAYPPLEGLPGANVVREKTAEKTEPREGTYTVEVEGLDVSVKELWFFEYRYLGEGRLRGGFVVGPQVMRVSTAVQDIGPGELRFGAERPIARSLRGQITTDIPRINPEEHADASFLELVVARINLRADVVSLGHVGAYLDGIDVSRGSGPFMVDLFLEKGVLGGKSHLNYDTEAIRVRGQGYGVDTDWRLEFHGDGEKPKPGAPASEPGFPLVRSSSKLTYVSLARNDREFTLRIEGHEERAELDTIKLSRSTDLRRASVRMPSIVSVDLDDLGAVFAKDVPLDVESGEFRASAKLDMDKDYWVTGPIEAKLSDLKSTVAGVRISGNTTLKARVKANPKQKVNTVEDVGIALRGVGMHVGDEHVEGWWMNLVSPRLTVWNTEPSRAEGVISVRAKDLEPVLEGLAEKDVLNDLIAKFTSLDDFRCKLRFRSEGPVTDVVVESESEVWDASGRVYKKGDDTKMAIVVGGQAVSLGIADLGGGLKLAPFAKTGWLNSHLRAMPAPLVQLPPAKP